MSRKSENTFETLPSPVDHLVNGVQIKRNPRDRKKFFLRSGCVLVSLCGLLACNSLGLSLGRVVCHGLLIASLGAPSRKVN
ncbi:hypothetical protein [Pseudodesulfovibrio piezophilus]|uniref:hypothetical protein n=1 Tax=Pseudodesulfovibrio piezophilus TaxID=879567 RepID=UPI00034BEFB7|nr:hypothetical protein [Pseudodesulfovibrio piezophilus]